MVENTMVGPLFPSSLKSEQPPSTSNAVVEAAPPDQPLTAPAQVSDELRLSTFVITDEGRRIGNADGAGGSTSNGGHDQSESAVDKDYLCPICMQIIRDAFLTACGHSFCYMCIITHLGHKNDCPCCGRYLVKNQIFPNFALDKILRKMSGQQSAKNATPMENLCQAMRKAGCDVTLKEINALLSLLLEKKKRMEREEAETNIQVLLEFLHCMKKRKLEELNEIQNDLEYIKEDIDAVEKRGIDLNLGKKRYPAELRLLRDDSASNGPYSSASSHTGANVVEGHATPTPSQLTPAMPLKRKHDATSSLCNETFVQPNDPRGPELQLLAESKSVSERKKLIHEQFNELHDCYLQARRQHAKQLGNHGDMNAVNRVGYHAGLEHFQSVLSAITRYSRFKVIAHLRQGNMFQSANIISSIEFDRDDELFATAGVSRCIKVFEYARVVKGPAEVHCPIVELTSRSKLSCLSWNKYMKSHIASCDYEGIVTVWDTSTRQSVMEYEEHEKRSWSVDFSRTVPTMLVSGSDDCTAKIWCTRQESSVINISMKANVCAVKFNPGSSTHLAVGSADHRIFTYDLRNVNQPLHVFTGHRKAVSYVKFLSSTEVASASTDNTLRLWDVKENCHLRTYRGHRNEKNFVGLSVNSQYLACGSETNEAVGYHKAISRPAAKHSFNPSESEVTEDDSTSHFTSAMCWRNDSPILLAANSHGTIKVLALTT